jgi:TrkA-C domain
VLAVIVVLAVSLLVARIGSAALALTGLSREVARFQARSAFFGVGFTTAEAETVVGHPVRRRIVLWLILLGNAGIVGVLASVVLSLTAGSGPTAARIGALVAVVVFFAMVASSRWVDHWMSRLIERGLRRWTDLDTRDYEGLLHLAGDYAVSELVVEPDDWLADRTLAELELDEEGVLILGITRTDGQYLGAPGGRTTVLSGDTLVLYGSADRVAELDRRAREGGDAAHAAAVSEQERVKAAQRGTGA